MGRDKKKIMKVKIEKIVYPGNGLVKDKSKVIIIEDGVVPDDIVELKTVSVKKDFIKAGVKRYIHFSPMREKYICKNGGKCGGCLWMGIKYDAQINLKKEMLIDVFRRNASINLHNISLHPNIPPFPYRQRARFKFENGIIGFYKRRSHQLIETKNCPICLEGINRGVEYFKKKYEQYKNNFPDKMEIEIRYSPYEDSVLFKPIGNISQKLKNIFHYDINKENEYQNFEIAGNNYHLSIKTFTQINPHQNELVIGSIRDFIQSRKPGITIDLYGGFGNLTLPSVDFIDKLIIVEENPSSIEDGRYFVSLNGLNDKVEFIQDKVENIIDELPAADIVILDPPRRGAYEFFKKLDKISPKAIIYLSCNPSTMARDIKIAIEKGYDIVKTELFDFFPYTPEIETLVILEH